MNFQATFGPMFEKAAPHLSLEKLDALAKLPDEDEDMARRLAVVTDGLACLVANDEQGGRAGNFQNANLQTEDGSAGKS